MFNNYIKIALRSLWKNKIYSFINISGLSIGMTVSVLILLFVSHEYSFNKFHKNADRIYRVEKKFVKDGRYSLYANPEFAPLIKEMDTDVINYLRIREPGRKVVSSDPQHRFFEDKFVFADTSFFSLFSFELLRGTRSALSRPHTVIITEETAIKYFGKTDPMGKNLIYDKDNSFEIVGVAKKAPSNSSIQFDFVASFASLALMSEERKLIINNSSGFPSYLLLRDKSFLPKVEKSILKTQYTNSSITYMLEPFSDARFNLNFGDTSNTQYVFIFLCVAMIILALALINYMNLTTARASVRAKEVGVRKVIGARRNTLSFQFFLESAVTTMISFAIALVMIEMLTPLFLNELQQEIDSSFLSSPLFMGIVIVLFLVCIILSGSYPALVLPRFKPVDVIKGKFSGTGEGVWMRKGFTVFQFSISVGLIICTLVVQDQLDFLRNKNIGLNKEQVMVIATDASVGTRSVAMKNELRQQSGVLKVSAASIPLFTTKTPGASRVEMAGAQEQTDVKWIIADNNFMETLGISWREKPEGEVIGKQLINETAVGFLKITDHAAGKEITMRSELTGVTRTEIAGVVNDFNFRTLRSTIEPLIISIKSDTAVVEMDQGGALYVRLQPTTRLSDRIEVIKKIVEKYQRETPFSYYFLDDAFDQLYKGELRLAKIFNVFTGVAIGIACLGLFGLITFTVERRTKEIGIRKVLGASATKILSLLSAEFMILLFISIAIAIPLAWRIMQDWLSHFSYRIEFPLWIIAVSGLSAIAIALVTMSFQTIKAALGNPVDALRNE